HAHEGAAEEIHPVQHQPPGNGSLAAAEPALRLAQAQRARLPAEAERVLQACRDPLQHRQVEVDRVPAGQYVRVEGCDAVAECIERSGLAGTADSELWHRAIKFVHDQHFVEAGGIKRNGQQPLPFRVSFDVEGQDAWLHVHVRRPQLRIVEHPPDAFPGDCGTFDLAAALDASLYQVTCSEADIGLERFDVRRVQAIPEWRHVGRNRHVDAADGRAVVRASVEVRGLRRAEPLRAFGIGRPDVEMWSLPVVTNQKAVAVFQSPVTVLDRVTVTPGAAGDTIRRLENEAASRGGHRGSLHEMWQQGARTTSTL